MRAEPGALEPSASGGSVMSTPHLSQTSGWSDERVATLSKLWRDGLSASQIARQLGGVTRNAVIGKVHRLGLSGRAAPSRPRALAQRPSRARHHQRVPAPRLVRPTRALVAPPPEPPEGPGLVDDFVALAPHACKWPIGDPKAAGFSFCGRQAHGRYCAAHQAQGVRAGTAWRAEHDPVVKRALAGLI